MSDNTEIKEQKEDLNNKVDNTLNNSKENDVGKDKFNSNDDRNLLKKRLPTIDELEEAINKYKKIEEILNKKNENNISSENQDDNQKNISKTSKIDIDLINEKLSKLEKLEDTLSSLVEKLGVDKNNENLKAEKARVENEKNKLDSDLKEELSRLKSEIEELKKLADISSKINSEIENSKRKLEELERSKIQDLLLRRQELIESYNLQDFEDFIPNPIKDPNITEKDIKDAILNLLKKEVVKIGLDIKNKKDLLQSKQSERIDVNKLQPNELQELKMRLLKRQTIS
jgi:hypothetical protein